MAVGVQTGAGKIITAVLTILLSWYYRLFILAFLNFFSPRKKKKKRKIYTKAARYFTVFEARQQIRVLNVTAPHFEIFNTFPYVCVFSARSSCPPQGEKREFYSTGYPLWRKKKIETFSYFQYLRKQACNDEGILVIFDVSFVVKTSISREH